MQQLNHALKAAIEWCKNNDIDIPLDIMAGYMRVTKDFLDFNELMRRLIIDLYNRRIGSEFTQQIERLLLAQLREAYEKAWTDGGNELPLPDYLRSEYTNNYFEQIGYVRQLFQDIIDSRIEDESEGRIGTGEIVTEDDGRLTTGEQVLIGLALLALLARARLWANRYNEAYNNALMLMEVQNGGKMIWRMGKREQHCDTCKKLDGMVAYAREWELTGFHPQGAPNWLLECGGWNCGCTLSPTSQERDPNVMNKLMSIAAGRGL